MPLQSDVRCVVTQFLAHGVAGRPGVAEAFALKMAHFQIMGGAIYASFAGDGAFADLVARSADTGTSSELTDRQNAVLVGLGQDLIAELVIKAADQFLVRVLRGHICVAVDVRARRLLGLEEVLCPGGSEGLRPALQSPRLGDSDLRQVGTLGGE